MAKKDTLERVEAYLSENYSLRKNVITGEIEIKSNTNNKAAWQEFDIYSTYRELLHNEHTITLADLDYLIKSDFVQEYDPFKEYFAGLPIWTNGGPDYITEFLSFIKVDHQVRFEKHFTKWLVRAIKCCLEAGYINKHLIILVGERQNTGKSTWIRFLMPAQLSDYFTENISTDKDSLIAIIECFLINMDELQSLSKYELNALKSIISKAFVKIRAPYDRKATNRPRRASFIGSTNETEFLTDVTGNIRWIPFNVISIDWSYRAQTNIDNIWAQAYSLYLNGFECEITADEIKENEEAAKMYSVVTFEMELLSRYFVPGTKDDHDFFLTTTEIELDLRSRTNGTIRISNQMLGKALRALSFPRDNRYFPGMAFPYKAYYLKKIYQAPK